MSTHVVNLHWSLDGDDFSYANYSRNHVWDFAQAGRLGASSAPEYLGDDTQVDPEQAFVAAVSSCHMLTFLAIASRKRLTVRSYSDQATGWLEKNTDGRLSITRIELRPQIEFAQTVSQEQIDKIHHQSHIECFIANSVNTIIEVVSE